MSILSACRSPFFAAVSVAALFGLTSHANTLGPVALLAILLELYAPYRRGEGKALDVLR